jgi:hypothetical protein
MDTTYQGIDPDIVDPKTIGEDKCISQLALQAAPRDLWTESCNSLSCRSQSIILPAVAQSTVVAPSETSSNEANFVLLYVAQAHNPFRQDGPQSVREDARVAASMVM